MSSNEPLTEYLPQVRCTPTLKSRLERLAERSVTRNLADHIRFAVENYVDTAEGSATVDATALAPALAVDRAALPTEGNGGSNRVGSQPASAGPVSASR